MATDVVSESVVNLFKTFKRIETGISAFGLFRLLLIIIIIILRRILLVTYHLYFMNL